MLMWSMSAVLKSISFWATAAVPPAANNARPETSSRRLSEPFSNWLRRLEMIDSIKISFLFAVFAPHELARLRLGFFTDGRDRPRTDGPSGPECDVGSHAEGRHDRHPD